MPKTRVVDANVVTDIVDRVFREFYRYEPAYDWFKGSEVLDPTTTQERLKAIVQEFV